MELDFERCYRAVDSRDRRFDGWFVTAVTSTGIYCRPSCPAITPKRRNVRFYPSAAAAQRSGFRACRRCRPDAAPGSPDWDVRADVVGRAMRLIGDGVVDREGIPGLAARLGYTDRHLHRMLTAELGAGPLALARAQRAQTARILIESTDLGLAEIAFAAGFGSVRQFNETIREVYAVPPSALRAAARPTATPGAVSLRLAYRAPLHAAALLEFLAARAVPGVEHADPTSYSRALRLPHGTGSVTLTPSHGYVDAALALTDLRDLAPAVARCRRLLDLDADPEAVTGYLSADPVLGPLALANPGRRSPGHVDGNELALRAVLGQQVSVTAARRLGARLVAAYGKPLSRPDGPLTHCFPEAGTLAAADPAALPMPRSRALALTGLASALASGELSLDPGAERDRAEAVLLALPGIGPWTASYIRMRALSDPDAFLPSDIGVLDALARLGAVPAGTGPAARGRAARAAAALAENWRPWRSYAVHHLWAYLEEKDR